MVLKEYYTIILAIKPHGTEVDLFFMHLYGTLALTSTWMGPGGCC